MFMDEMDAYNKVNAIDSKSKNTGYLARSPKVQRSKTIYGQRRVKTAGIVDKHDCTQQFTSNPASMAGVQFELMHIQGKR